MKDIFNITREDTFAAHVETGQWWKCGAKRSQGVLLP
jgi:hypothetical protein